MDLPQGILIIDEFAGKFPRVYSVLPPRARMRLRLNIGGKLQVFSGNLVGAMDQLLLSQKSMSFWSQQLRI